MRLPLIPHLLVVYSIEGLYVCTHIYICLYPGSAFPTDLVHLYSSVLEIFVIQTNYLKKMPSLCKNLAGNSKHFSKPVWPGFIAISVNKKWLAFRSHCY